MKSIRGKNIWIKWNRKRRREYERCYNKYIREKERKERERKEQEKKLAGSSKAK